MPRKKKNDTGIPYDIEAEASVIGTIIENAEALEQGARFLTGEDFWDETAGAIFDACLALRANQTVDKQSILALLNGIEDVDRKQAAEYIDRGPQFANAVEFSSNVSRVKNTSILRQLMNLAKKVLTDITVDEADGNIILQDTRSLVTNIEAGAMALPPRIVGLEIATTNPRSYVMKLSDGREVNLGIEDLMSSGKVKRVMTNALDFVPALPKDWDSFLRRLMRSASVRPASGVDLGLDVLDVIRDLFDARGEARAGSDLRTGSYTIEEIDGKQYYLFQKRAVTDYVKQQLKRDIDTVQLWRILQQWGAIDNKDGKAISKWIGGDSRHGLWGIPVSVVDEEQDISPEGVGDIKDLPWD